MRLYAIIVAGGKGTRMGSDVPKQFLPIGGKPVLMRTIEVFYDYSSEMELIVVLPFSQHDYWTQLCGEYHFTIPHKMVGGGETRFHSVLEGLGAVQEEKALVAVHDGVRPFVNHDTIDRCFRLADEVGAAVPVMPLVESMRKMTSEIESVAVERSQYRLVQTPQVFEASLLKRAYMQPYLPAFTDDASVVEALGHPIFLTEGNCENIKLTSPFDLRVAETILKCTT